MKKEKVPNLAVKDVSDILGGNKKLANALGVHVMTVHQWMNGTRPVPPLRAIDMEHLSGGRVSCESIQPDLIGRAGYLRGQKG